MNPYFYRKIVVLFLEIQTLREASMYQGEMGRLGRGPTHIILLVFPVPSDSLLTEILSLLFRFVSTRRQEALS
jgi:hypothetical protein